MTEKTFKKLDFYGNAIFIEEGFAAHLDVGAKTLMVMEKDYTDFNAVLMYEEDSDSIKVLPRWQTNFIFKADGIYVVRERFDGQ